MRNSRRSPRVVAAVALILIAAGAVWWWVSPASVETCDPSTYDDPSRDARVVPDHVVYLDQGWTPGDSMDFYTHTQGSRLIPYSWFIALERPDLTTPFHDPDHLARFGFLTQHPNTCNPDGLPVGFVKDPPGRGERTEWLGFTCAACHTAEIHYGDAAIRIDGGPASSDMQSFLIELTRALRATADDPEKFDRFARRILGDRPSAGDREDLSEELARACRTRREYDELNATTHPYGHSRLDAFGRILNQVLVTDLDIDEASQRRSPDAPVSYPHLWDTPHHDYVQWNGSARNKILGSETIGSLSRNVGQVLGVFGRIEISEPRRATVFTGYNTSARIPDLIHLEKLLHKLESPRWPDQFPSLDPEKVEAGESLFLRHCARCHDDIDRDHPDRSVEAVMTPMAEVGTDPRMATNFATRRGKTGRLEGRRMYFVAGPRFGTEAPAEDILVHTIIGAILDSRAEEYREARLSELRRRGADDRDSPDELLAYKARPLNGIWATAPYLHNGSVPNLYQLLLPAEERVTEFPVGGRRFDPKLVGFETDPGEGRSRFRVTDDDGNPIPGNSNAGHEYGAGKDGRPALTEQERWQLLEYLKSL